MTNLDYKPTVNKLFHKVYYKNHDNNADKVKKSNTEEIRSLIKPTGYHPENGELMRCVPNIERATSSDQS